MQSLVNPISNLISRMSSQLVLDNPAQAMAPVPELRESVEQAKLEWMCARDYFEEVTDPGLIDYAIYQVKAAERRYMHLLAMARGGSHSAPLSSDVAPSIRLEQPESGGLPHRSEHL